jgi:cell wall assembly regulator SMI1
VLIKCCVDARSTDVIEEGIMQDVKQDVINLLPLLRLEPKDHLPSGAAPQDIDLLQQRIGVTLPAQLVEWLSICNGPCVAEGGVYGIRPDRKFLDMETRLESLPVWCGRNFIPVAGDGCGSHYVLAITPTNGLNPVYFVDHEDEGVLDEPSYVVASDLWHFLHFLFQAELGAEGWPFDRTKVLQEDPELIKVEDRLLPWSK